MNPKLIGLFALVALAHWGCTSTVTPDLNRATQARFHDNEQTAGLLGQLPDRSGVVDEEWVAGYKRLRQGYGNRLNPAVTNEAGIEPYTNGTYRASAMALENYGIMNLYFRNGYE